MKNDKVKLRVKALSKGDTMINYMDDTEIAIKQKTVLFYQLFIINKLFINQNKNDKNKLSFKEKDSLRNLLDAIIANRKFNETEENGNENENLTQLINKENFNLIEIFSFIRKMYLNGLSISAINLEKLSEISIK